MGLVVWRRVFGRFVVGSYVNLRGETVVICDRNSNEVIIAKESR